MSFFKRISLATLVVAGIGMLALAPFGVRGQFVSNVASVFFAESHPGSTLQAKYEVATPAAKAIRILVAAGHEPHFGGAVYHERFERDMTVALAQFLAFYLEQDSRFQVLQTRDTDDWNPVLAQYFVTHASTTDTIYADKKDEMTKLIESGLLQTVSSTPHNTAPVDVARRLYGINLWANEQKVDLVINIHFNDAARRDVAQPGPYSGFTVFVPERQYSNSSSAKAIADEVTKRLRTVVAVSDLKPESGGVVEDQELISLGRYNTLNAPSLLIEYGYLYERQFDDPTIRRAVLQEMAFQTAAGIQDFFVVPRLVQIPPATTLLPYRFESELVPAKASSLSVLSLEAALHDAGDYPAATSTLHNCPLSGYFDTCTIAALTQFQTVEQIEGEAGILGTSTRAVLNRKYGKR